MGVSGSDLRKAASQGDAKKINNILKSMKADKEKVTNLVNSADEGGKTAIFKASEKGYACVVKLLLEVGACPEVADTEGYTCLLIATYGNYAETVRALLQGGSDTSAHNIMGSTSLIVASYKGNVEIVKCLLDHQANIESRDVGGRTSLYVAARSGRTQVVKCLLSRGADPVAKDLRGCTAVDVVATDILKSLLLDAMKGSERAEEENPIAEEEGDDADRTVEESTPREADSGMGVESSPLLSAQRRITRIPQGPKMGKQQFGGMSSGRKTENNKDSQIKTGKEASRKRLLSDTIARSTTMSKKEVSFVSNVDTKKMISNPRTRRV